MLRKIYYLRSFFFLDKNCHYHYNEDKKIVNISVKEK